MINPIATVVLAALAAGTIASPVAAESRTSVLVPYGDLKLSSPAGTATLERRIDAAASVVCERPGLRNLKAMVAWEECKASARVAALEQFSMVDRYETLALAGAF